MATVTVKKVVQAAQCVAPDYTDLEALGGEQVHLGFCAEHDKECMHLSTPDGNVAIDDGDWLVKDGDEFSIFTNADFQSQYTA